MEYRNYKKKQTVIVIEDDEVLLESYKYYFSQYDDYILKGAFSSIAEALDNYEDIYPNIIISDISMKDINGIEGIPMFKSLDDKVKVVIVSVHDDIDFIMSSIKNKADGYVTKPVNKTSLLNTINALNDNGAPLSDDVSKKLLNTFQKKKHKMFSEREHEILELFTKGYTYKAIANQLCVTSSTINFHLQNIYNKLDVTNKSDALEKLATII